MAATATATLAPELAAALMKGVTRHNRAERLAPVYAMFPDLLRQRTLPAGRLSGGRKADFRFSRVESGRHPVCKPDFRPGNTVV